MDTYLSKGCIRLLIEYSKPGKALWMNESSLKFEGKEINKDLRRKLRILVSNGLMRKDRCIYTISQRGKLRLKRLNVSHCQ